MSVVFCASNLGGPGLRVLARFITDHQGLHAERFDRHERRWVQDPRISGFLTGQDDWSERISTTAARRLIEVWGYGDEMLSAPVAPGS